jgi:hypothetical protein
MMKWLPLWMVDKILLLFAWLILGNLEKYGLTRPCLGPLQLKNTQGKTPVLDIGALEKIRSGKIKVVPGIKRFSSGKAELVNGEILQIDSVILATGYRSNVPSWLKVRNWFAIGFSILRIFITVMEVGIALESMPLFLIETALFQRFWNCGPVASFFNGLCFVLFMDQ